MTPTRPDDRPGTGSPTLSPPVVMLQVWGVPARHVPHALLAMATHPRSLRRTPGIRFAKLLGTGRSSTFTLRDADIRHWAALTVWDSEAAARAGAASPPLVSWDDRSDERLDVLLRPVASRGRWSGEHPFEPISAGDAAGRPASAPDLVGPAAAITRARLRLRRSRTFWRAVPTAVADLHRADGLVLSLGIGESPVAHMGTFSLWQNMAALRSYAYRSPGHTDVVRRTKEVGWYAEELFARFTVISATGALDGTRFAIGSPRRDHYSDARGGADALPDRPPRATGSTV